VVTTRQPIPHVDPTGHERKRIKASAVGLTEFSTAGEPRYEDAEGLEYSNFWFQRDTQPLWGKLDRAGIWPPKHCKRYLEIGVCEGASLFWFLNHAPQLHYALAVDPYVAPRRHKQENYDKHLRTYKRNYARWRAIQCAQLETGQPHSTATVDQWKTTSQQALVSLLHSIDVAATTELAASRYFQAVYIDGAHDGPTAQWDIVASWQALEVGGVMIVDDIHRRWHLGRPWVKEAVDGFLLAHEKQSETIYRGERQIVLRKLLV